MMASDQTGYDWAVVLRRQRARMAAGTAAGGYTGMFEIVCRDCGDDLALNYRDVSPRLQLIRGPYMVEDGIAAYEAHLGLH